MSRPLICFQASYRSAQTRQRVGATREHSPSLARRRHKGCSALTMPEGGATPPRGRIRSREYQDLSLSLLIVSSLRSHRGGATSAAARVDRRLRRSLSPSVCLLFLSIAVGCMIGGSIARRSGGAIALIYGVLVLLLAQLELFVGLRFVQGWSGSAASASLRPHGQDPHCSRYRQGSRRRVAVDGETGSLDGPNPGQRSMSGPVMSDYAVVEASTSLTCRGERSTNPLARASWKRFVASGTGLV